MKKILFLLLFPFIYYISFGQISTGQTPRSFDLDLPDSNIPNMTYNINLAQARYEDSISTDTALAIGRTITINLNFLNEASQTFASQDFSIYQLRFTSDSAKEIGIFFNNFHLPVGAELYAYNQSHDFVVGAFTSYNNTANDTFAIQPVAGESVILELYLPSTAAFDSLHLEIDQISNIYNSTLSSNCYEDVYCGPFSNAYRAVLKWKYRDTQNGIEYGCSCALLNQDVPANDLKPYIYTANHCGKNADLSTAIFYFNYQHPVCNGTTSTEYYTTTGATKKAKKYLSDMFLMELYQTPPPDYNAFYAGWDRGDHSDVGGFVNGVHHPHGEVKAISQGSLLANTFPEFWRVKWDMNESPTAGGSSGSPLFDFVGDRVIGDLSFNLGFWTTCDLFFPDHYGKFRNQWNDAGGSDKELESWLDPNGNDPNAIDGRDPCFNNLYIQNRHFYPANQYQPDNRVTIQAANIISATNVTISSGSEYHFTAGDKIILGHGFHAENGSFFKASKSSCTQIAMSHYGHRIGNNTNDSIFNVDLPFISQENSLSVYPNPFNHKTIIEYSLEAKDGASIFITDIYGRIVYVLEDNIFHEKGTYQIDFDNTSTQLPEGVYLCIINTSTYRQTRKMIILK